MSLNLIRPREEGRGNLACREGLSRLAPFPNAGTDSFHHARRRDDRSPWRETTTRQRCLLTRPFTSSYARLSYGSPCWYLDSGLLEK